MIKNYDLVKTYIAELGFDPNFLASYISPFTKSKALRMLQNIQSNFGTNPDSVEYEISKLVEKLSDSNRNKRFAIIIIMFAYEKNMISGKSYDVLRKQLGGKDYDDNMKEKLKSNWVREMATDPFSILEGKQTSSL